MPGGGPPQTQTVELALAAAELTKSALAIRAHKVLMQLSHDA